MTKSHLILKLPLVYDFRLSTDKFFKLQGFLNFYFTRDQLVFNCSTNPNLVLKQVNSKVTLALIWLQYQFWPQTQFWTSSSLTFPSILTFFNFDLHLNFDLELNFGCVFHFPTRVEPKWTQVFLYFHPNSGSPLRHLLSK